MARHDVEYKLEELAEQAGLPPRTIRYYVQRGLLPQPVFRGRDTSYGEGHLLRLRLIRQLQDERFLPLDAIASELEGRSDDELRRALKKKGHAGPSLPPVGATSNTGESWARVVVADGVELHVRAGADCDVAKLAARLRQSLNER